MKEIPVAVEWTANDEGVANGEEQAVVEESPECEKRREATAGPVRTLVAIWIGVVGVRQRGQAA